jgi:5-methylcytosine-specific restriction endonuclease McrA
VGLISKTKRDFIYKRDGNRCVRCGFRKNLTVDHIVPKSKGGSNKYSNLQTLCFKCNQSKQNTTINYVENNIAVEVIKERIEEIKNHFII